MLNNSKPIELSVNIVDPHSETDPIRFRRYTIDESDVFENRINMIIGPEFEELELGVTTTDIIYAQWYWIVDGFYHLTLFAYVGDGSYEVSKERYEQFLEKIPVAALAIVKGDREFLLENEQLLAAPIYVRFISTHDEFNKTTTLFRVSDICN